MFYHSPIAQNRNWAWAFRQCLFELEFGLVLPIGDVRKATVYLNFKSVKLKDCYLQKWHSNSKHGFGKVFLFNRYKEITEWLYLISI